MEVMNTGLDFRFVSGFEIRISCLLENDVALLLPDTTIDNIYILL